MGISSLNFYLFEIRNELVCHSLAMHFISVVKNHRDHSDNRFGKYFSNRKKMILKLITK